MTTQDPNYHNPFAEDTPKEQQPTETQTFPKAATIEKPSQDYKWIKFIIAMLILFGSIAITTYLLFPPPPPAPPAAQVSPQVTLVPELVIRYDNINTTSSNVTYWVTENATMAYISGGGDSSANLTYLVVGGGGGSSYSRLNRHAVTINTGTIDQAGVWRPEEEPANTTNVTMAQESSPVVQVPVGELETSVINEIFKTPLLSLVIIIGGMILFLSVARNTSFFMIACLGLVLLLYLVGLISISVMSIVILTGTAIALYRWAENETL